MQLSPPFFIVPVSYDYFCISVGYRLLLLKNTWASKNSGTSV